jgi:hypothetical protein
MQDGGSAWGGETAGVDGLTKLSLEPEGGCLDVASNGACPWILGFLEAMTALMNPAKVPMSSAVWALWVSRVSTLAWVTPF